MLRRKDNIRAAIYIAPAFIASLLVHFLPITMGIYISFLGLDRLTLTQLFGAPFVKLQNFITIFSSGLEYGESFIRSLKNISYFGLMVIPITFVISMIVALMMNRKFFGRTIVRGLILLPFITPDAVMYNIWRFIFQNKIGILNHHLLQLGIIQEPVIWLVGETTINAVIIAHVWKNWPYASLILLAGLQTIPSELYEAARIDGANVWRRFVNVTMPMLGPIIKTSLVMGVIWTFHAFNQFYVLYGGSVSSYSEVPAIVILRIMQTSLDFGVGAAMSFIVMLIIFVVTFVAVVINKSKREEI